MLAALICAAPVGAVVLFDGERAGAQLRHGDAPHDAALEAALCRHVRAQPSAVLVVPDVLADPRVQAVAAADGAPAIRCFAGAALCAEDGRVVGVVYVVDAVPRALTAAQHTGLAYLQRTIARDLAAERGMLGTASAPAQAPAATAEHAAQPPVADRQKLDKLLAALPVGISILNADRKVVYSNPALQQILQLDKRQLRAGSYRERSYLAGDGSPLTADQFASEQAISRGQAVFDVETGVVKEDDEVVWTNVSAIPLEDPDWSLVIATTDITRRKEAEVEIKHARDLFLQLFHSSPIATVFIDLTRRTYVDANLAATELLGCGIADLTALPPERLGEFLEPASRARLANALQQQVGVDGIEVIIIRCDGSHCACLLYIRTIEQKDGRYALCQLVDIAQRKRSEQALQEAEYKYRTLVEQSPVVVYVAESGERWQYVSPQIERILGYTAEEFVAAPAIWKRSVHPDDLARIQERAEESLRSGNQIALEYRMTARDGRLLWVHDEADAVYDPVTDRTILHGVFYDITERKLSEEAVQENQAKLDAALNSMSDAVFISDLAGNFIEFNDAFATFHKFRDKAECAKTLAEYPEYIDVYLDTGEVAPLEQWAVPRALRGEVATNAIYGLRRKDTGEHWIGSYSFAPIRNNDGRIVGSVVVGRDVTEQMAAAETLRRRTEELEQLIELMPAVVWLADDPGCLHIRGNRYANELLGVAEGANVSQSSETAAVRLRQFSQGRELAPDDLPMQVAARTGQPQLDVELHIERPDGEAIILLGGAVPLFDAEGATRGAAAVFQDITHRMAIEAELRRSNAELEQFAYVASHDLQEPLRAVSGMVQLLHKRYAGQLDERADEYIKQAVDASVRMQTLINDLLAYSRVDRYGRPMQPTDSRAALERAQANLQVAIDESGASITHDALPVVMADSTQIVQLFQNLLANALKFCGAETPKIHISVIDLNDTYRFEVHDNGIGIDPQYFDRIFLVFQRLHTRREYPGTGIGLALCKKIVERHGGQIWVESQPGAGATFYFTLPKRTISDGTTTLP